MPIKSLLFLFSTLLYAAELPPPAAPVGPTLKQRQDCEVTVTRGFISIDAKNYSQASEEFHEALKKWPDCYLALEGLALVYEGQNNLKQAIEFYLRAKHNSPNDRWAHLNFHAGRLYLELKITDRAELYLKLAREQKAFPVQVNYLLGYLYYLENNYAEAEKYFFEAKQHSYSQEAWATDEELRQAIHYYLGEIYTRLGYSTLAIPNLWRVEEGKSTELRKNAWKLHGFQNRFQRLFGFGVFHFYDGNVPQVSYGLTSPRETGTASSQGVMVAWDGAFQSPPGRKWVVGGNGYLSLKYHLNSSVDNFDEMKIIPRLWVKYWNLKNHNFQAGYFISRTGLDRYKYSTYEIIHGPEFRYDYLPHEHFLLRLDYSPQFLSYPLDSVVRKTDSRDGNAQDFSASLAAPGPNPWIRPQVHYRLRLNNSIGSNYQHTSHLMGGECDFRLILRTEAHLAFDYETRSFPNSLALREDTVLKYHLGLKSLMLQRFVLSFNINLLRQLSSVNEFRYNRFEMYTGVLFRFD